MGIYSPMPHTLSYCALMGKCALIRLNTVVVSLIIVIYICYLPLCCASFEFWLPLFRTTGTRKITLRYQELRLISDFEISRVDCLSYPELLEPAVASLRHQHYILQRRLVLTLYPNLPRMMASRSFRWSLPGCELKGNRLSVRAHTF